jgi:multidrug resistance efflux pump
MINVLHHKIHKINLPMVVIAIAVIIGLLNLFSFLIPVTNNAFVVTNITPIAADVSGFITKIYVKNGQSVKKGDPLIKVYQKPYCLAYERAKAEYETGIEHIVMIQKQTQKTRDLLNASTYDYEKARLEYNVKHNVLVRSGVPALEIKTLHYHMQSIEKKKNALQKQIAIEDQQIVEQRRHVEALKAVMENARVNMNLTIVRAPSEGVIDNLYIAPGTPVKIHEPLFSFIDTKNWWIQANFNETDLRRIRPGDEAYIILRMYYFRKLFHGRIVNTIWAANRQNTAHRSQLQQVKSENQWLMIPQRLPLQIKILDPDPNYPLQPGASAYVYLKPHTHNRHV